MTTRRHEEQQQQLPQPHQLPQQPFWLGRDDATLTMRPCASHAEWRLSEVTLGIWYPTTSTTVSTRVGMRATRSSKDPSRRLRYGRSTELATPCSRMWGRTADR